MRIVRDEQGEITRKEETMAHDDFFGFEDDKPEKPQGWKEDFAEEKTALVLADNQARFRSNCRELDYLLEHLRETEDYLSEEKKKKNTTEPEAKFSHGRGIGLFLVALLAMAISGVLAYLTIRLSVASPTQAVLAAIGFAVTTAFAFEILFEIINALMGKKALSICMLNFIVVVACISLIAGLGLAKSRGYQKEAEALLERGLKNSGRYDPLKKLEELQNKIEALNRRSMSFLFLSLEIISGISLFSGLTLIRNNRTIVKLSKQRDSLRERILQLERENHQITNTTPAQIKKDILMDLIKPKKNWTSPLAILISGLILGTLLIFFLKDDAFGQENDQPREIIISLDVTDHHPKDRQENSVAIQSILRNLSEGESATVITVTNNSFSSSNVIVRGLIPEDSSHWNTRAIRKKNDLINRFIEAEKGLPKELPSSDALGSLFLAGNLFDSSNRGNTKKVLYIFSNMQHVQSAIALMNKPIKNPKALLERIKNAGLVASLEGIQVSIYGASPCDLDLRSWNVLKRFWQEYFALTGAVLKTYSINRPNIR